MLLLHSLDGGSLGLACQLSLLRSRGFLGGQLRPQLRLNPLTLLLRGRQRPLVLLLRLLQCGCLLGLHLRSLRCGLCPHRPLSLLSLVKHALHQLRAVLRRC